VCKARDTKRVRWREMGYVDLVQSVFILRSIQHGFNMHCCRHELTFCALGGEGDGGAGVATSDRRRGVHSSSFVVT